MNSESEQSGGPSGREQNEVESILLSVREVAHLLCIGERTVWRLSSIGELPSPVCIGRCRRWGRRAIEDYVAAKTKPRTGSRRE